MIFRTLALLTVLLLPLSQVGAQTTITGHHIENTSVGFYGFGVNIPRNYGPYPVPKEKDFKIKTHADLAWSNALGVDRKAGATTLELIPLQSDYSGMVLVVIRFSGDIPSIKDKIKYLQFLDKFMSWNLQHSPDDLSRDTRKIGDTYVGRNIASASSGKDVIVANIVLPPRTVLMFQGACSKERKDDLLQDLDAAVATLDFGKRARFAP